MIDLIKDALFRGGLTVETLNTLLVDERATQDETKTYTSPSNSLEQTFVRPQPVPVAVSRPQLEDSPPTSNGKAYGEGAGRSRKVSQSGHMAYSYDHPDSFEIPEQEEEGVREAANRVPVHDQRTILITNVSDRTTHKDLVGIIRGGRVLDIFLRNDRSATVSFVEGAGEFSTPPLACPPLRGNNLATNPDKADFLAHAKRNDIYLHTKRLEFRWNDRQFHVPQHVANKIANGASRNLIVRGALGKLGSDQIRDHLDHIHNLVVSHHRRDSVERGEDLTRVRRLLTSTFEVAMPSSPQTQSTTRCLRGLA